MQTDSKAQRIYRDNCPEQNSQCAVVCLSALEPQVVNTSNQHAC